MVQLGTGSSVRPWRVTWLDELVVIEKISELAERMGVGRVGRVAYA